tara:strand:- start:28788 stop:29417 length:630 start_codon:yes stop_codon:yes gene_type:complete
MKTRIIKTKYWSDSTIHALSKEARYLFIYLLTSPYINLCGVFELPDEYLKLETGLTDKELQKAKDQLLKKGRVKFMDGWVAILNSDKHNGYRNSPTTEKAYQKELESVPSVIRVIIDSTIDTSMDSTMHSTPNPKMINNNKEILNDNDKKEELKSMFPKADVEGEIAKMLDWLAASGKSKKDYLAFARNWLRRVEKENKKLKSNDRTNL